MSPFVQIILTLAPVVLFILMVRFTHEARKHYEYIRECGKSNTIYHVTDVTPMIFLLYTIEFLSAFLAIYAVLCAINGAPL